MAQHSTTHLIEHLLHHAKLNPQAIAIRHKSLGLWREYSWSTLLNKSQHYAAFLHAQHFSRVDRLLILSSPHPEQAALSFAVQALGASIQFFHQDWSDDLVENFHEKDSFLAARFIVVDRLEHAETLAPHFTQDTQIYYIEPALKQQNDDKNQKNARIIALSDVPHEAPIIFEHLSFDDSYAAFIFEKKEHGVKLILDLSHRYLIQEAQNIINVNHIDHTEEAFISRSFSSVGHIRYLWSTWLVAGFTLNIPESLATRDQDRQMIAPTLVLGTKLSYERLYDHILLKLPEKNTVFRQALERYIEQRQKGNLPTFSQKVIFKLFKHSILAELGLSQLKTALIVGEALSEKSQAFFQILGIELQFWDERTRWTRLAEDNLAAQHYVFQ